MKVGEQLTQKQLEAIERQSIYDSLSIDQKIAQCKSRCGDAAKELARLNKIKKN